MPELPAEIRQDLYWAIAACREMAAHIERNLPAEDGAPDAPPMRTADWLDQGDADEWRRTAQVLDDYFGPLVQGGD